MNFISTKRKRLPAIVVRSRYQILGALLWLGLGASSPAQQEPRLDGNFALHMALHQSFLSASDEIARIEIYRVAEDKGQETAYYPLNRLKAEWRIYATEDAKNISRLLEALQMEDKNDSDTRHQARANLSEDCLHIIAFSRNRDKVAYIFYHVSNAAGRPCGFKSSSSRSFNVLNFGFCDWLSSQNLLPAKQTPREIEVIPDRPGPREKEAACPE